MDREEFRRRIETYVSPDTPDLAKYARRVADWLVEPLWALVEPWHALRRGAEASKHLEADGDAANLRSALDYLIARTAPGVPPEAWVPGTVCRGCQRLPRELFPDKVRGAPGGPWGDTH